MTNVINEHAKPPAYSGAEKGMEQIMKTVTIYNIDKTRSTQVRAAIRVQFDLPKGAIYEKESSASARHKTVNFEISFDDESMEMGILQYAQGYKDALTWISES